MAIKVGGTTVIDDSRALSNITSVDATTVAALDTAGVGGGGFSYASASGATPSLDVGDFNFFDAGTINTETVNVSFTNVPTQAKWEYTGTAALATSFDLSQPAEINNERFIPTLSQLNDLFIKPDGTQIFTIDPGDDRVRRFDLSTAWDLSTWSDSGVSFSVSSEDPIPRGLFFKPDGTRMYFVGAQNDTIYQYNLSTAWDITSASYYDAAQLNGYDSDPRNVAFSSDGTKVYYLGNYTDTIKQFTLNQAWSIGSIQLSSVVTLGVNPPTSVPEGLGFSADGTKMFLTAYGGVFQYNLSTAWNISTASAAYSGSSTPTYAVPSTTVNGVTFSPDGANMYLSCYSDRVLQISSAAVGAITFPSSVQNPPTASFSAGQQVTYTFFTSDSGTNVRLIAESIT